MRDRRNSLGFEFSTLSESESRSTAATATMMMTTTTTTATASIDSAVSGCGGWPGFDDDDADGDSAFVDDDLESSWDQLRLRQFKEQLSTVDEAGDAGQTRGSLLVRLMKRFLATVNQLFANGRLDRYEKIILVLAILLIADSVALSYLLATYPVYRDVLGRLGYQILFNSTGYFFKASPLRDL